MGTKYSCRNCSSTDLDTASQVHLVAPVISVPIFSAQIFANSRSPGGRALLATAARKYQGTYESERLLLWEGLYKIPWLLEETEQSLN